ncbi:MAPEG family protein [Devosia sp. A8/3-2]|nr:MAPEG family protein [Devosia sp. A8/3-2]
MLLMIFPVLALLVVAVQLPGSYLTKQVGVAAQIGPRDNLPEPTQELARSRRAPANLQETLPIFLTLAVLSIVHNEQSWVSLAGAGLYFLARGSPLLLHERPVATAFPVFSGWPAWLRDHGCAAGSTHLVMNLLQVLARSDLCH